MSYCRDNGITSNVYMYPSILGGIICCGCSIEIKRSKSESNDYNYTNATFYSRRGAINHLVDHTKNGDLVPNYAFQRLNDEIKDYGDSL